MNNVEDISYLEHYQKVIKSLPDANFNYLRQGNRPLVAFVTKAQPLVEDGRYNPSAEENTLRGTVVIGMVSDKVHKDKIPLGNGPTLEQVYDPVKVDESTTAQIKKISKGDEKSAFYTVQ